MRITTKTSPKYEHIHTVFLKIVAIKTSKMKNKTVMAKYLYLKSHNVVPLIKTEDEKFYCISCLIFCRFILWSRAIKIIN